MSRPVDAPVRIGIIGGAGWLGGAIAGAILDAGLVRPGDLTLSYRRKQPSRFAQAAWTADNQELVDRSDVVIVSVRPADWPAVRIGADGRLVISVMAGIRLDQIAAQFGTDRVVRSLPNAAAELGRSYTPWVASQGVTRQDRVLAGRIFEACGTSDEVGSEAEIDYLTGLSGSGPAFPALLAEAMMRDAIARGIDPRVARRAVTAVLVGTGALFERTGENPSDTVETFLSYEGTTTAAIRAMRAGGFDTAVAEGLAAALRRSVEMGRAP
jgi:pyrroline-5-carboxylate reductase